MTRFEIVKLTSKFHVTLWKLGLYANAEEAVYSFELDKQRIMDDVPSGPIETV